VATAPGVSGLELAAGVSVAVSAEMAISVDRARAMSSRISHKICAGNGSEDRGDQSYQSYATSSTAKSSKGQPMTTEFATEEG
jgi:hypothetical protein